MLPLIQIAVLLLAYVAPSLAQLNGNALGPSTSTASKVAKRICNVQSYGAKADQSTDLGPFIVDAFNDCKSGGVIWIPPGNYAMATWAVLSGGSGFAIQLDGIIYRTGTAGGHMIVVENSSDVEFFSLTSKGAIQGYGYQFHLQGSISGPRLVRFININRFSFHDMILVDAPAFHLIFDTCTNGEVYNVIIRGGNEGGLDGIDVWGTNIHIHDIEVTNKDECVTVKNPSDHLLIENIYCNSSGGCAIGSLGTGTDISYIQYRNVYTWNANQMFMLKSNGGDGTVTQCTFENFIGHGNAYSLYVNEYWSSISPIAGNGVELSYFTFSNWTGGEANGVQRGPILVICADTAPCQKMTLSNINLWTESGSAQKYECESAYGSGYCLKASGTTSYITSTTVSSAPAGYSAPKMPSDLPTTGVGVTVPVTIPAAPTTFFPGLKPISTLLNGNGAGASSGGGSATTTRTSTTTAQTTTTTSHTTTASGSCQSLYGQCGGIGYTGATTCCSGATCVYSNAYYSQCLSA